MGMGILLINCAPADTKIWGGLLFQYRLTLLGVTKKEQKLVWKQVASLDGNLRNVLQPGVLLLYFLFYLSYLLLEVLLVHARAV
jgi:hypothetical protein